VTLVPIVNFDNSSYLCTYSNNGNTITCNQDLTFISARARYWFFVMSHCNQIGSSGIHVTYKILMTNGDYAYEHHFSADEFGILQTSITMFILYTLFVICGIVCYYL
jgi:hypothetical protein